MSLFFFLAVLSNGQEIVVKGAFVNDSIRIGEPVQYWLTARYPAPVDLFLPDSTYDFSPFEFFSRTFYETKVQGELAFDSVVYSLQSFEIDPVQYLRLPSVVYSKKDTLRVFASLDSIYFRDMVPVATDTTALKVNTQYQRLARQFNSPLVMILLGVLVVIGLIVLLVFGKKIKRHFQLKRMAKAHGQFTDEMLNLIEKLKLSGDPTVAEHALSVWKKYQERIEKQPFSKLTSKEIVAYDFAAELYEPLRMIDRCVYGKIPSAKVFQDFQHLQGFCDLRYKHIVEQIKHGA
jgi:hypothetical protein